MHILHSLSPVTFEAWIVAITGVWIHNGFNVCVSEMYDMLSVCDTILISLTFILLDLSYHAEYGHAWKAAWLLECMTLFALGT